MTVPSSAPVTRSTADTVGVVAAAACAIHCLALSLVVASTPLLFLNGLLAPWVAWAFVAVSMAVGLISLRDSVRPGRPRRPLLLFVAGLTVLLLVRTVVGESSAWLERGGLVLAATLSIAAHVQRARGQRHRCASPAGANAPD